VALRDIALTVLELEPNEYHWVLMEAVQAASEEVLEYRPIDSSTQGLPDYSEALIQGASALRVLQGLAPFGKPMTPVGFGESTAVPLPQDATSSDASTAAAARAGGVNPSAQASASGTSSSSSSNPDTCMFTTDRSAL
jgi:hypothetical protein